MYDDVQTRMYNTPFKQSNLSTTPIIGTLEYSRDLSVGGFMDGFVDKYPNQVQVEHLVLMPGYQ